MEDKESPRSSKQEQPNHRDATDVNPQPAWKGSVERLEIEDDAKQLLTEFLNSLDGTQDPNWYPELRPYAIECFLEKCQNLNKDPQQLQNMLMDQLPQEEIHRLFNLLPKGTEVRVTQTRYHDGTSPQATRRARAMIQKFGLFESSDQGDNSFRRVDDQRIQELLQTQLPDEKPTFELTQQVTIMAENIQGYSVYGTRVRNQDGQDASVNGKEVDRFIITGVNQNVKQRRPRELYPDRRIQYWSDELKQWIPGVIKNRVLGDTVLFIPDNPIRIPHPILGESREVSELEINVGPDAARYGPQEEGELPKLGTASFEQYPWLYQKIDLSLEQRESPYKEIPEAFRPGALIWLKNKRIGRVTRSSTQGMAEIWVGPNHNYERIQWIQLPEDEMPTVLEESPHPESTIHKGARVVFSEELPQELPEKLRGYIYRFGGYYTIDEKEIALLEALPCFLGNKANMPEMLFYPLDADTFDRLALPNNPFFQIYNTPIHEALQQAFPNQYDIISKYIKEDCSILVNARLKDGREIKEVYAYLHCMPLGIWCIPQSPNQQSYTPELVPIDQFEEITFLNPE